MINFNFLLPFLVVACVVVIPWTLKLWDKSVVWPTGLAGLVSLIAFLYCGVKFNDPDALPQLRQLFTAYVLSQPQIVLWLCFGLAFLLGGALFFGISSQTLCFAPEDEMSVEVKQLCGGPLQREKLLGWASSEKPLVRRVISGKRHFRFVSPGFKLQDREVVVMRSWMSGLEQRLTIRLGGLPEFELLEFGRRAEHFFDFEAEGLHLPESLKPLPGATIALTLANLSSAPVRVQNLRVLVEEVQPLQKSTFPVEGLGGDGDPPLLGYVALSPRPQSYEVVVNKAHQGRGADPTDYLILTVSPEGYRYRVRVQLRWTDSRNPRRGGEHLFEPVQELDFPRIVPWEQMAQGAQQLRIHLNDWWVLTHMVLSEVQSLSPKAHCSALISSLWNDPSSRGQRLVEEHKQEAWRAGLDAIATLSTPEQRVQLSQLVGEGFNSPRSFILLDEHTLLVQSEENPQVADVVTDAERVQTVARLFDSLLVPPPSSGETTDASGRTPKSTDEN